MGSPVQGTQVVGRVASLLRLVGRKPEGSSLAGLVRESGLTRPTVHRLLTSLAAEGLLDHDARSGNWILGPEVFLLGSVAAQRDRAREIQMMRLESVGNLGQKKNIAIGPFGGLFADIPYQKVVDIQRQVMTMILYGSDG